MEIKVTPELVAQHGLTPEEYERIKEILGREPNFTELGIFSVMWSEHCSYKSSLPWLKSLPREGENLLAKAGEENAGAVEIGDGWVVVFKMESHNHPSAVEPYQGAATGVGGIMRDIFAMGARPIASLNSLRFGNLESPQTRYLFDGVVRGIADYGNCFGVPNVGGEVYFEDTYQENPLVNVMALGVAKRGYLASALAKGPGNPVFIVGSSTGRDGIHGATFASEELNEKSQARRPSVQIGDPFMEKLLLEACLEAIRGGHIVGIQDMGAAGITCSTSEMAAKGGCGMKIDLDKVPRREEGMIPYELMLSESQERMLLVVERGYEEEVKAIFKKWELNCEVIGQVVEEGWLKVREGGEVVASIPPHSLVVGEGAPVYKRKEKKPKYLDRVGKRLKGRFPPPADFNQALLKLLSSPTISSKEWVYRQYDTMVRTNTLLPPGSDAAVIRIKKLNKGLALTADGNGRYCYLDPRMGGRIAVAEAARNLICSGAKPLAVTDCLNFGNPEDPEVFWTFARCVEGIGEACRAMQTPVTGGNVSFYNQSPQGSVYPTPVIGMVGLIDDLDKVTTQWFKEKGDLILLLGENRGELGGSEYLRVIYGMVGGGCPVLDLDYELRVQALCRWGIAQGLVKSAHDLSEGGLAIALAEACLASPEGRVGAWVDSLDGPDEVSSLFGESQSRIIVTVEDEGWKRLKEKGDNSGVKVRVIGKVGGDKLKIGNLVDLDLGRLEDEYRFSLVRIMEGRS